jgi:cytochrome c oxidase subunit I
MRRNILTDGLRALPASDKRLLLVCFAMALLSLLLGVLFGTGTALARAGLAEYIPHDGFRMMTQHGVTIFFYWLYFAQAGLLMVFAAVYSAGASRIAWRGAAWAGLAAMIAGFLVSQYVTAFGDPMLYDAPPGLAWGPSGLLGGFYLGYLLLAVGLFLVACAGVATVMRPRFEGNREPISAVGFASIAWAGLLMVSAVASVNAFLPAARWAFGLGPEVQDYSIAWHVLFHNMHYLPLMATVLTWYVLVEAVTGVKSIFGPRFSKIVFSIYLIFVPPTSLYHMFLEPDLAEPVRVVGSLLSLFISVPTLLVFLIIVASLEVHARARGARGLFGWMRELPWGNPAMSAIGMAVLAAAMGGAFSFVLIQEQLAPLLSDTFFVPGYFHFLTVGTVTLTFLGALTYVLPALTERPLWRPHVLARLPYLVAAGLALFGTAGVIGGYLGVPRRAIDVSYLGTAPEVWAVLMAMVGIGGTVMAIGLLAYLFGLIRTAVPVLRIRPAEFAAVDWSGGGAALRREHAWVGPLSVVVLVLAMAVFTVIAFELMQALPLVASGGAGH